jgi:hypothetical protein
MLKDQRCDASDIVIEFALDLWDFVTVYTGENVDWGG